MFNSKPSGPSQAEIDAQRRAAEADRKRQEADAAKAKEAELARLEEQEKQDKAEAAQKAREEAAEMARRSGHGRNRNPYHPLSTGSDMLLR